MAGAAESSTSPSASFGTPVKSQHSADLLTPIDHHTQPTSGQFSKALLGAIKEHGGLLKAIVGDSEEYEGPFIGETAGPWGNETIFLERAEKLASKRFYAHSHVRLSGSPANRKPDVCIIRDGDYLAAITATSARRYELRRPARRSLLDLWSSTDKIDITTRRHWHHVRIGGELKAGLSDLRSRLQKDCLLKLLELLRQPGRRFALLFSCFNNAFRLWLADATGVYRSPEIDAVADPQRICHLLWRLSSLTDAEAGLLEDFCPTGPIPNMFSELAATVDRPPLPSFQIRKVIRFRGDMIGRCTSTFEVRCGASVIAGSTHNVEDGGSAILKLAFVDVARTLTEPAVYDCIEMARKKDPASAMGLPTRLGTGAPNVSTCDHVGLSAKEHAESFPDLCLRHITLLLLRPAGVPITSYSSRSQFMAAFCDCVKAHERLRDLGFLHRDISISNLILNPAHDPTAAASTAGILIDFDLAVREGREGPSVARHRTGTLPFMATALLGLLGEDVSHKVAYDLESFFYVLLVVCARHGDPDQLGGVTDKQKNNYTHQFDHDSNSSCTSKLALNATTGWKTCLADVDPYWTPLHGTLTALRDLFRPVWLGDDEGAADGITHQKILEILETGLEAVRRFEERPPA